MNDNADSSLKTQIAVSAYLKNKDTASWFCTAYYRQITCLWSHLVSDTVLLYFPLVNKQPVVEYYVL